MKARKMEKETKQFLKGIQLNNVCLKIAVIHWILSFFTDHLVFQYVMWDFSNLTQTIKTAVTYGAKAVFLLVLIAFWQGVYYFAKKANRSFVKYTLIYFGINMCMLLLTWPGIWRMDEFGILNSAVLLFPVFWQSYLTSIFYIFSMMLLPFPAGVIIVQCACASLVVGYVICVFKKHFGKWGLFGFAPFLFLPVLDSNLYPMRMSVYAFWELLLLILVYELWNETEKNETTTPSPCFKKAVLAGLTILAAIVTVWRTEAIYYILLFPILLCILFKAKIDKKTLTKTICIYLVCTLVLFVPQKLGDQFTSGNQYDLTSVVLPLVPLVEKAADEGTCDEELSAINNVVRVDIAVQGAKAGMSGIKLFWSNPFFQREEYTDEEYSAFKSSYYKLILKYPTVFLKERWTCFMQSSDLLENTTELFTRNDVANYTTFQTYPLTQPVSDSLRSNTIKLLEWKSMQDYTQKKAGYPIVYGAYIPMAIMLLATLYCLLRKRWAEFFILALPLVKIPLIFLTAPSRLFMYYYSLYMIGYVLFFYILLQLWMKVWKKIGTPVAKTIRYAKRNGVKAAYYAAKERVDHTNVDALTKKAQDYVGNKDWSVASDTLASRVPKGVEGEMSAADITMEFNYNPLISIVVPTYETKEVFLTELLQCVIKQTYTNWELVLADASHSDCVKDVVDKVVAEYGAKIKYIRLKENKGISDNTNVAIEVASGDYIALLDHDDLLTFDALENMVARLNASDVKKIEDVIAIYSDEDKCDGNAMHFYEPYFKPDFNLDLLLSNNYICHFLMVKADIFKQLKLRSQYDGAQDYDLVLRLALLTGIILHEPSVLYHWRCHEASTAINTDSKRYAYDAGREALKAYYEKVGLQEQVTVTDSNHLGFYTTTYQPNIFAVRKDIVAVCGRVIEKGMVVGSPDHLFDGLRKYSSGYMHRADLYMDVTSYDERAIKVRTDLEEAYAKTLDEALKKGYKLVYDPNYVVEI